MQQPSSLPWPTQKRDFYPENLLCLPEKANFSHTKKKFLILYCKNFSHLSEKKKSFFQYENSFYNYWKKQLSKQRVSYTCQEKPTVKKFLEFVQKS